jgi:hypothetical protein
MEWSYHPLIEDKCQYPYKKEQTNSENSWYLGDNKSAITLYTVNTCIMLYWVYLTIWTHNFSGDRHCKSNYHMIMTTVAQVIFSDKTISVMTKFFYML